jgi:hypothetical protein
VDAALHLHIYPTCSSPPLAKIWDMYCIRVLYQVGGRSAAFLVWVDCIGDSTKFVLRDLATCRPHVGSVTVCVHLAEQLEYVPDYAFPFAWMDQSDNSPPTGFSLVTRPSHDKDSWDLDCKYLVTCQAFRPGGYRNPLLAERSIIIMVPVLASTELVPDTTCAIPN